MAITRAEKEARLSELESEFGGAESIILVDYKGLDVPQATELRRKVKQVNASYRVVKNSLARRAFEGTPFEVLGSHIQGTTAVAYSSDDPVLLAKTLVDFSIGHFIFKNSLIIFVFFFPVEDRLGSLIFISNLSRISL